MAALRSLARYPQRHRPTANSLARDDCNALKEVRKANLRAGGDITPERF
jgi:hypothetical protein